MSVYEEERIGDRGVGVRVVQRHDGCIMQARRPLTRRKTMEPTSTLADSIRAGQGGGVEAADPSGSKVIAPTLPKAGSSATLIGTWRPEWLVSHSKVSLASNAAHVMLPR